MNMKKIFEFLAMTRTERIGTLSLLVILAFIMSGTAVYKSCSSSREEERVAQEMLLRAEQAQLMHDSIAKARADSVKALKSRKKIRKRIVKSSGVAKDVELQEVPQY